MAGPGYYKVIYNNDFERSAKRYLVSTYVLVIVLLSFVVGTALQARRDPKPTYQQGVIDGRAAAILAQQANDRILKDMGLCNYAQHICRIKKDARP